MQSRRSISCKRSDLLIAIVDATNNRGRRPLRLVAERATLGRATLGRDTLGRDTHWSQHARRVLVRGLRWRSADQAVDIFQRDQLEVLWRVGICVDAVLNDQHSLGIAGEGNRNGIDPVGLLCSIDFGAVADAE